MMNKLINALQQINATLRKLVALIETLNEVQFDANGNYTKGVQQ